MRNVIYLPLLYFPFIIFLMSLLLLQNETQSLLQIHSIIETTNCVIALIISVFLLSRQHLNEWNIWFVCSLLIISILGVPHAIVTDDSKMIWSHAAPFFLSGLISSMMCFHIKGKYKKNILFLTLFIIVVVFLITYELEIYPTTMSNGEFSHLPVIMHLIGSLGFLASFVYMVKNKGDLPLALFLLLFSLIGVMFGFSTPWGELWWLWHFVELFAFCIILVYFFIQTRREYEMVKASENQLAKSNEELMQFAYVASHDLKAPLRAVSNLVSWIEEDLIEGKDVKEHVRLTKKRIQRMENLINGLLEYSRIGRTEVNRKMIDLAIIIKWIEEELEVRVCKMLDFREIKANQTRIKQLFSNLISNSIKHHHDLSNIKIEIGSRKIKDGVECWVKDNGPGIDPIYHKKIFSLFQTLKSKDTKEGTGVGLSLVKKIVSEYDGEIWVESKEGEGATFRFTLLGV